MSFLSCLMHIVSRSISFFSCFMWNCCWRSDRLSLFFVFYTLFLLFLLFKLTLHSALFFFYRVFAALSESAKKQWTVTALPVRKSYKSHCKTIENKHQLAVAFFAFWAIRFFLYYFLRFYTKSFSYRPMSIRNFCLFEKKTNIYPTVKMVNRQHLDN